MDGIQTDEPPVLSGRSVVSSVVGAFEINGNRFKIDREVHNLPRVPKAERERVNYAVASLMILRCPRGQYGRDSVFDTPDEFYVLPETGRVRIYAYNWGEPLGDHDLLLLRSLVPRSDRIYVCAMPLYSAPAERVTTLILDLLTDQEVTRRTAEAENAFFLSSSSSSSSSSAAGATSPLVSSSGASVISSSSSSSSAAAASADSSGYHTGRRDADSGDSGGPSRKRSWSLGLFG